MLKISFIILFRISLKIPHYVHFYSKFPSFCLYLILLFYVPSINITGSTVLYMCSSVVTFWLTILLMIRHLMFLFGLCPI